MSDVVVMCSRRARAGLGCGAVPSGSRATEYLGAVGRAEQGAG
jgi:hypothetical protein